MGICHKDLWGIFGGSAVGLLQRDLLEGTGCWQCSEARFSQAWSLQMALDSPCAGFPREGTENCSGESELRSEKVAACPDLLCQKTQAQSCRWKQAPWP